MESRISRIERSVEYLIGKVKKQSEWIHILEDKVRDLEVVNVAENKCLLSDSEKQAITEHGAKFKPSNNQKRDNVIWKAKRFIKEHKSDFTKMGNFDFGLVYYNIDFKVKKNKRTVEGLLLTYDGFVRKRVKVVCHPDDCFNVNLGKAIAIGRLLGLDVSDFENAPQPDEVVVGHVVKRMYHTGELSLGEVTVKSIKPCDECAYNPLYPFNEIVINDGENFGFGNGDRIIDDTDAKYKLISK